MPARRRLIPIAAAALAVSALVPATGAQAADEAYSNRLIVGYKGGVSSDRRAEVLERAGGKVRRTIASIGAQSITPRGGVSLDKLRSRLLKSGRVRYVEPDFVMRSSKTPDDPQFSLQYGLSQPDGKDISAPVAWDTRTSCTKLAVVDTGVDTTHPDLKDNLLKNDKEVPSNNKDDDKNGYVDDYYGWNANSGKGNAEDDNGHGTHVTGIAAARTNNDDGVAGVCWKASVLPVKFMDSRGKGSTSDAVAAIEYAVKRGIKIINCSFGSSSKSSSLQDVVDYAQSKGVLLVVAAGNDSENIDKTPSYPASYSDSNILTVAATDAEDGLASFSNYGPDDVDMAAPGDEIRSTYLDGGYKYLSGTSMASPYVAGAAALLKAANSDASYSDLRTALRKMGDTLSSLKGKVVYGGRLDLKKALDYINQSD